MMHKTDARYYQIAVLACLLLYGLIFLNLETTWESVLLGIVCTVLFQHIFLKLYGVSPQEYKSAFISSLSLGLLFRSNYPLLIVLAGFLTIFSKFILRVNRKHVFNPTNFSITVLYLLGMPVWISPGQWGSHVILAGALSLFGLIVVRRAERSDITLAFLLFYSGFLVLRALYLGDPLTIPLHQLQNGSLVIFSFFMISDPKTIPDSRLARILFAFLVAALAYYIRFNHYNPNALVLALFFLSPLVPLFDLVLKAKRFQWAQNNEVSAIRSCPKTVLIRQLQSRGRV